MIGLGAIRSEIVSGIRSRSYRTESLNKTKSYINTKFLKA